MPEPARPADSRPRPDKTRRARSTPDPAGALGMAARPDDLAGHLRVHHYFSLPAGEGGRHQYDALPRRPGAHLRQQVCIPAGAHPARRHCGVPLSARSLEEFYQAGDRAGRRPDPHRVAAKCSSTAKRSKKTMFPPPMPTSARIPRSWCRPNSYFVLGDHRTMSNDSRDFGPVNIGYIYGKAVFGYWPMDKMGRVR